MRRGLKLIVSVVAAMSMAGACSQVSYPESVRFPGGEMFLFRGAEHCDWDGTWMVYVERDDLRSPTTWISGTEVPGPFPTPHMFVRDPSAVAEFSFDAPTDLGRTLPSDARSLGRSSKGYELWYADSDAHYIYVVSRDRTEAWVRATDWFLCA